MAWDDDEDAEHPRTYTQSASPWYIYPVAGDAPGCPFKKFVPNGPRDYREPFYYGPVENAVGLLNEAREGAYFALTSSEDPPPVLDGWEVEPAKLNDDFEMDSIRLVRTVQRRRCGDEWYDEHEFDITN